MLLEAMENTETAAQVALLDGNITDAQLKRWKYQYKRVVKLSVEDDDGTTLFAYFRKPTIDIRSAVLQASKMDEFKALEVLFKNCYLGGDTAIEDDDDLRLNITTSFSDFIQPKPVKIEVL
ncbi:hypothetical protein [Aquimarina aggregata]|uniref:hypothetical protein n=2 Tax=Aquimarina aggregata TaxID=1642818 RepID=UPI0024910580|nr:hypothetical protein [Aquimarina aggregata]